MNPPEATALELLTSERTLELWPKLQPLLDAACKSNMLSAYDISAEDIYMLSLIEMCAIFVAFEGDEPACVVTLQFTDTNGRKGVSITALAGRNLNKFKMLYWEYILSWLRANGVLFLDVHANERMANIYSRRFGFDQSCIALRKML
jgi:hypothetical protein